MFTPNIGKSHRIVRVIAGTMMGAGAVLALQGKTAGYVAAIMGLMALMTGLSGYCPACSMIGTKANHSS